MIKLKDILNEDAVATFTKDLNGERIKAKVYTATGDGKTVEAQFTNKKWDDGVPVTKYLTRGGLLEVVQSDLWSPTRLVLVEFPSMDKARAFHNSEEYADVKKIRLDHAKSTLVILEGL